MKSRVDLLLVDPPPVPKVPMWARPRGVVLHDADAAYLAGAALNSLDNLVRQDTLWAGAWRHRLALQSAAAAVNLIGRREDESALRDTHFLRGAGDDPDPSGHLLLAWRRLASRTTSCDEEFVRSVAEQHFGLQWDDALTEVLGNAEDMVASSRPAPVLAAEIAAAVYVPGNTQALESRRRSTLSELLDRFCSAESPLLLQIPTRNEKLIVRFSTSSDGKLSGPDGTPVTAPRSSR